MELVLGPKQKLKEEQKGGMHAERRGLALEMHWA